MEYRSLGRTGMEVSKLCLGCMTFGRATEQDEVFRMVDRAIEVGINFLDTANVYGRGKSETAVGQAMKRNRKRDWIVLATKVHSGMGPGPNMHGNSRRHIMEQCEASLRRLQTDWIDLYQIHRPQADVAIDETLRALDDLVRSGKVRYVGTSTYAAWQIVEALWASQRYGLNRFVSEQPPYHLLDRRIERELIPMARTYGLGLIPWSPLAGGAMSGKYKRGQKPQHGRWSTGKQGGGRELTDAAFDVIEAVEAMAKEKGCTPSQLALAWCMSRPGITSPIIGPRTFEQLEDNLGSLDVKLDEQDHDRLDEMAPPGGVTVPYYDADWGPHPHRV